MKSLCGRNILMGVDLAQVALHLLQAYSALSMRISILDGATRMKRTTITAVVGLVAPAAAPAIAQQVTGTLGSPSATTTISGKQLPPPEPKFGGVMNLGANSRWSRRTPQSQKSFRWGHA
jgi:hypothetical protein